MEFSEFIAESANSELYLLGFGQSQIVGTAVANRFLKQWQSRQPESNIQLPTEIGQPVVCRPPDQYRGTITVTKLDKNRYEVKHHNDATDETKRLGYKPPPFKSSVW